MQTDNLKSLVVIEKRGKTFPVPRYALGKRQKTGFVANVISTHDEGVLPISRGETVRLINPDQIDIADKSGNLEALVDIEKDGQTFSVPRYVLGKGRKTQYRMPQPPLTRLAGRIPEASMAAIREANQLEANKDARKARRARLRMSMDGISKVYDEKCSDFDKTVKDLQDNGLLEEMVREDPASIRELSDEMMRLGCKGREAVVAALASLKGGAVVRTLIKNIEDAEGVRSLGMRRALNAHLLSGGQKVRRRSGPARGRSSPLNILFNRRSRKLEKPTPIEPTPIVADGCEMMEKRLADMRKAYEKECRDESDEIPDFASLESRFNALRK